MLPSTLSSCAKADQAQQQCRSQMYGCDNAISPLEVLDLLNKNLRKEYILGCMLGCVCWGKTLTGYQFAKAAFHSYPYFPDTHSMMAVMYDDYSHLGGVEIFGSGTGVTSATAAGVGVGPVVGTKPVRTTRGKRNTNNNSSSSPTYGNNLATSGAPISGAMAVNGSGGGFIGSPGYVNGMPVGGPRFYVDPNQPPAVQQQQQQYIGQPLQQQYMQPQGQQQQQYSQMLPPLRQQQQYSQLPPPPQQQQYTQQQPLYGQPLPQQYGRQLSGDAGSSSFTSGYSFNSSGSYSSSVPNSWVQQQQQQQGAPASAAAVAANSFSGYDLSGAGPAAGIKAGVSGFGSEFGSGDLPGSGPTAGNGPVAGYEVQNHSNLQQGGVGGQVVNGQFGGLVGGSGDGGGVQGVYEQWVSGF